LADFPHLKLSYTLSGEYRPPRPNFGDKIVQEKTGQNLNNRSGHGNYLSQRIVEIAQQRQIELLEREAGGLPPLPDAIPFFLEIDPEGLDPDSLRGFGIEVLSVEDDGLVIGASTDGYDFKDLKKKISNFLEQSGIDKNQAAKLWNIIDGEKWRIEQILSEELQEKWSVLSDSELYTMDLSISSGVYISDAPVQKGESDEKFAKRLKKWRDKKEKSEIENDEIKTKRQNELFKIVNSYNGEILSSFVDSEDSYGVRIKINGKGLKDIVINFPYLFDVTEYDPFSIEKDEMESSDFERPEFNPPNKNTPIVCIIDSGIQEDHLYLQDAIRRDISKSYISNDATTADTVGGGGHGTRVAGAVLFGNNIPKSGRHTHITWLANAKVLTDFNGIAVMPEELYPPALINDISNDFGNCKVFNLSITSSRPCRTKHMSEWAAAIDRLAWETDILIVISTGNLKRESSQVNNPGVKEMINKGSNYPDYFDHNFARLANPSQAAFALTVGSVCISKFDDSNYTSFGDINEPSAFTRQGPGLWGMVKPDVVEYGGDYVKEKNNNPVLVTTREETSPETVRSTLNGGPAFGRDQPGTSFSTPKVSHVIAHILNNWPRATSLFIRALIVQSARWPNIQLQLSPFQKLKAFGYGIPSISKALDNSPGRITFVSENSVQPKKANVYKIEIPEELRKQTDSYSFLIEVTLSYKSRVRRTRQGTKSYVSSWADWVSSKIGESDENFKNRVIKYAGTNSNDDTDTIKWIIRERNDWGDVKGFKRNDSTLQKDWATLKSFELPEHLSIAVVGHQGWEKDIYKEEIPYCLIISLECLEPEIEIYNTIRIHNQIEIEV